MMQSQLPTIRGMCSQAAPGVLNSGRSTFHKNKNAGEHRRRFVQPRSFGPPPHLPTCCCFLAVDCCLYRAHGSPKPPPIHSTIYALVAFKKFTKRKNFSEKTEVRPRSGKELAL